MAPKGASFTKVGGNTKTGKSHEATSGKSGPLPKSMPKGRSPKAPKGK